MSATDLERRLQLLRLLAHEVSACHEDALGRGMVDPIIFLVDLEDSLGQRFAEHHDLHDPLSVMALAPDEALSWLGGAHAPLPVLQTLNSPEQRIAVVLLLWNEVSVHDIALG